jgi:hypothetical protein
VADTASATGAPAAPEAQPSTGNADAPAADAGAAAAAEPETISLDEAKKLRSEAKGLRTRLKELEAAEQARADADKSAEERAAERIKALETDLASERAERRTMALQVATIGVARKLGFRDPDLAHRLLSTDEIEFDEGGKPRNVEALLTAISKQHPYLVSGTADYGGGPRGTPPGSGDDMNARIRRQAGRA